ncbi:FAD-binding protein [Streptomyces tsukubensis]|uniref:FAD-binding PCMH-type domain-containing protein n=2 Tax=Streptomyces tsukubensis TaxID=83656 RepID=A0A1V4A9A8_9ACTN|nr:hypothetical protein B1H18_16115 [Streptomyces tsukubensis]QFR97800.1 FAD-binding protein [Streptomyces tsukubensis]
MIPNQRPADSGRPGRRTVLSAAAATLLTTGAATALTGCDSPDTGAKPGGATGDDKPRSPSTAPSASRTTSPPTSRTWSALSSALEGHLVRPGDTEWTTARRLYNTRFESLRPAAVAYVAHPADIRTALEFARAHGTPVAIRSGGHSYAGWSSGNGRLIVDVSRLSAVRASGDSAVTGAGARLIDVYRALAAKGTTIPAGSCPSVGISGLTLGGGHGVVSRAYGLTCDNLTGARIVTADGRERDVTNKGQDSDLFWALRGAGNGNFGIVTELRFRTHPAPRAVSAYLSWPWTSAGAVLRAWQRWGPDQPDEIWSSAHLDSSPGDGNQSVSVSAFSLGTFGELQNALDRLTDHVGAPARTTRLTRHSYSEAMDIYAGCSGFRSDEACHLPGAVPGREERGALVRETYAARSDFYDRDLPEAATRALIGRVEKVKEGSGNVSFTALGGAVNRVSPTATAFVHRRSRTLAQYIASWPPGTEGARANSWLKDTHAAMRPWASGAAYQNYTDATLTDWRRAYYGESAGRLEKLKERYDPDRLFTFPQAI